MQLKKRLEEIEKRVGSERVCRVWALNDWREGPAREVRQTPEGELRLLHGPTTDELKGRRALEVIIEYVDNWREEEEQ